MEPTTAPSKMRMEGWRQIGGWLAKQRETAERTWQEACHFLHRYYMDHHHPSRLPDGSLRSAWTGPGHDPKRFTDTRKWQALSWRCWLRLTLVGTERPAHHEQMKF